MTFLHSVDDLSDLSRLNGQSSAYRMDRSSERSMRVARAMAVVLGQPAPIIDRYLEALSCAPAEHLALLNRRGTRIVFAPTIYAALASPWAARRRDGGALSFDDEANTRARFGADSLAAAAYDSSTDALIFPTSYCSRSLKHAVLHELGHAITLGRVEVRPKLLEGLPKRIAHHVLSDFYIGPTPEVTMRNRIFEALAEGYVELVEGRFEKLPPALSSELLFMLMTMEEGSHVHLDLEETPDGGFRTASRISPREIVDGGHPGLGSLFAPVQEGHALEEWRLQDDEVAAARRRGRDVA